MQRQETTYRLDVDSQHAAVRAVTEGARLALERWVVGNVSHTYQGTEALMGKIQNRVRNTSMAHQWMRQLEASDGPVSKKLQSWAAKIVEPWAASRVREEAGALVLDDTALTALVSGPAKARGPVRALAAQILKLDLPIATVGPTAALLEAANPGTGVEVTNQEGLQQLKIDRRIGVRAGELLAATRSGADKTFDGWLVALSEVFVGSVLATAEPARFQPYVGHTWFDVAVADISL